jgi:glycosyltransferase involved in cell wall biosynthesis
MSSTPRVSIGLPVYNGEKYLAETIVSLLGQTYTDFELLISDNASTDSTAEICHQYMQQDPRVRYFRQDRNIGAAPNHNFLVHQARGEFFKWVASDDLYARDLIRRCIDALDEHPDVVLAQSESAIIDSSGAVVKLINYRPVGSFSSSAPERLRSMLFDGWGDDEGGVIRIDALRKTKLQGSYHFADRVILAELGLLGAFFHVPDYLYFRRDHPDSLYRTSTTVRTRCVSLDPRRANSLRHPVVRLYGEYAWSFIAAIQHAPLSLADRAECYRILLQWFARRAVPAAESIASRRPLRREKLVPRGPSTIAIDSLVAGREDNPC